MKGNIMLQQLRAFRDARKADDNGFALLELAIAMLIFGILVLVAFLAFGQIQQRAYASAARSDARQIGIAVATAFTDAQALPAGFSVGTAPATACSTTSPTATNLNAISVNLSKGDTIAWVCSGWGGNDAIVGGSGAATALGTDFAVEVKNASGAWAIFDSTKNAVVASSASAAAPAVPATF